MACAALAALPQSAAVVVQEPATISRMLAGAFLVAGAIAWTVVVSGQDMERRRGVLGVAAAVVVAAGLWTAPLVGRTPLVLVILFASAAVAGVESMFGGSRGDRAVGAVACVLAVAWSSVTAVGVGSRDAVIGAAVVLAISLGPAASTTVRRRWQSGAIVRSWATALGHWLWRNGVECAVGAGCAAAFFPLVLRLSSTDTWGIQGMNDYPEHLRWSREMSLWPFRPPAPHFLFHLAVRAGAGFIDASVSSAVVLSAAVGIAAAVIVWAGRHPMDPAAALSVGGSVLLAAAFYFTQSPTILVAGLDRCCSGGPTYAPLHIWSNPTSVLVVPFALGFVLVVVRVVDRPTSSWQLQVGASVLVAVGALAKPNYFLAAIPAAAVYACTAGGGDRAVRVRRLVPVLSAGALVLSWQLWYQLSGQPAIATPSGLRIEPFRFVRTYLGGGVGFYAVLWPILLGVVVGRLRFIRIAEVHLSLIAAGFSIVPVLLLDETGRRANQGNVAWGLFTSIGLLYVFSLRFLLRESQRSWATKSGAGRVWPVGFVVLLGMSAIAGCWAYLEAVGVLAPAA